MKKKQKVCRDLQFIRKISIIPLFILFGTNSGKEDLIGRSGSFKTKVSNLIYNRQ